MVSLVLQRWQNTVQFQDMKSWLEYKKWKSNTGNHAILKNAKQVDVALEA